jgi:hypothetical protein
MRRLALFVFAFAAMQVQHAQAAVPGILTISPQNCVWRAGDNPTWAAPNLHESGWLPWPGWNPASPEPRLWIRCYADLSSLQNAPHPAIQIELYAAYEIYIDGRLIGSAGNLKTGAFTMNTIREWPLSGGLAPPAVIALRVTRRIVSTVPVGPLPPLAIHAGAAALLRDRRSGVILAQVHPLLIPAICFCIIGILGIVLIPLWLNDRSRPELFLLSVCCVSLPAIYLNYLGAAALVSFPVAVYIFAWTIPAALVNFTRVLFFFSLARRRVPLAFWILILVGTGLYLPVAIGPLFPPAQAIWLNALFSHQLEAFGDIVRVLEEIAPFAAFLPWSRLTARMKPIAALSMMWGTAMMFFFAVRSTGAHIPGLPNLQALWGNAAADGEAVTVLSVVIALFFLLFREQQQTARERAILASEMQAAQQVQAMLAPAAIDTAPGLHIEVAFHSMREVGGDFYLCRVLPDGRQRIVIGDVSGKGTAAAMAAALLLGGAAARDSDSPASLLAHLNRVLKENRLGGFATCICADMEATGTTTTANAGHLPPYRNGAEVDMPGSLPLGLNPGADYSEVTLTLAPGDRLTFLSDGVVEAQSAAGELFGFDRTRQISAQSAEAIARAAQAFGQQDDITVLTLQFAPVEVAHA